MKRTCQAPECNETLEGRDYRTRYCSSACRLRAHRARQEPRPAKAKPRAAAKPKAKPPSKPKARGSAEGEPTAGTEPKIDPLVQAVQAELTKAGQAETVDGQIALHLARQVKAATGSSAASLAKELRQVLDRALEQGPPATTDDEQPAAEPAVEHEDEVTRARRQRDEARQAAGLT